MRKHLCAVQIAVTVVLFVLSNVNIANALHATDGNVIEVPDENTASFSIHGSLGMLKGEAHEIVYEPAVDHRLSELIWDISGITMGGVVGTINFYNIFRLNIGYWSALTEGNGGMEDYDWYLFDQPDTWTHLSQHDVKIVNGWIFDVNVSTELYKFQSGMSLRGQVGVKQDYWKWEDSVKKYIYSSLGHPLAEPSPGYSWEQYNPTAIRDIIIPGDGGRCIDYNQSFTIPYIGVSMENAWDKFRINGYLNLSVGVSAEDHDFHRLREIHFKGTFSGGTYVGVGLSALYNIDNSIYVMAAYDYQSIPEIKGDTEIEETGIEITDGAEISNEHSMLSVAVGMTF